MWVPYFLHADIARRARLDVWQKRMAEKILWVLSIWHDKCEVLFTGSVSILPADAGTHWESA